MSQDPQSPAAAGRHTPGWKIFALVLLAVVLSVALTLAVVFLVVFPSEFRLVTLSPKEAAVLEQKLERIDPSHRLTRRAPAEAELTPERYTEEGASREVVFSERELNALLAQNTDLAHRLVIDLSTDLASAKLLVPLDPEFPLLGGRTLKLTAGLEMRYAAGRPVVMLRGVSLWGVPLPNAWLGNVKNIDLVGEFGADQGFWQAFAEGVDDIEIQEGRVRIRLRE